MSPSLYVGIKEKLSPAARVRQNGFCPPALSVPSAGVASCYGCTYGLMTDGAQCLQVIQRALSSSTVDRLDVVDLPEITFNGSSDHLVQLKEQGTSREHQSVPLRFYLHLTVKKINKQELRMQTRFLVHKHPFFSLSGGSSHMYKQ